MNLNVALFHPLRAACERGHWDIVQMILNDKRLSPSDHHDYLIRYACEKGILPLVKWLLNDPRVDPGAEGNTRPPS